VRVVPSTYVNYPRWETHIWIPAPSFLPTRWISESGRKVIHWIQPHASHSQLALALALDPLLPPLAGGPPSVLLLLESAFLQVRPRMWISLEARPTLRTSRLVCALDSHVGVSSRSPVGIWLYSGLCTSTGFKTYSPRSFPDSRLSYI
jgi:hypothetical protein